MAGWEGWQDGRMEEWKNGRVEGRDGSDPNSALTGGQILNYSADVDYSKIITIEPGKRSGKPCIRGMRITVQDVFEYLAGGMTEDQILEEFPELTREDIHACFAFAADRERKLFVAPA